MDGPWMSGTFETLKWLERWSWKTWFRADNLEERVVSLETAVRDLEDKLRKLEPMTNPSSGSGGEEQKQAERRGKGKNKKKRKEKAAATKKENAATKEFPSKTKTTRNKP